jgi:hypothetical protein
MPEEEIPEMIDNIFKDLGVNESVEKSLTVVEELVMQMEELINSDYMWENAVEDETSRRVICAAIGVIALKFADISDGMIEFINKDE